MVHNFETVRIYEIEDLETSHWLLGKLVFIQKFALDDRKEKKK